MAEQNATVNANDLQRAHEEPTIQFGPLVYRGRVLSIEEWLPFFDDRLALEDAARRARADGKPVDMRAWTRHWIRYLEAVFPRRRFKFFAPNIVAAIRKLPGNGLQVAYERFFFHQGLALAVFSGDPPKTPGTDSRDKTPAGAATASEG